MKVGFAKELTVHLTEEGIPAVSLKELASALNTAPLDVARRYWALSPEAVLIHTQSGETSSRLSVLTQTTADTKPGFLTPVDLGVALRLLEDDGDIFVKAPWALEVCKWYIRGVFLVIVVPQNSRHPQDVSQAVGCISQFKDTLGQQYMIVALDEKNHPIDLTAHR